MKCHRCGSASVRRGMRRTNLGKKQLYLCRKCGKFTIDWPRMRFKKDDVMHAVKLYRSGLSAARVKSKMEARGAVVSRWTIIKWARKFG